MLADGLKGFVRYLRAFFLTESVIILEYNKLSGNHSIYTRRSATILD